jgi:hypothetical protein
MHVTQPTNMHHSLSSSPIVLPPREGVGLGALLRSTSCLKLSMHACFCFQSRNRSADGVHLHPRSHPSGCHQSVKTVQSSKRGGEAWGVGGARAHLGRRSTGSGSSSSWARTTRRPVYDMIWLGVRA